MSGFGGVGLVQSRGGGIVVMRPGDTIYTPPGEWHWHGAALNCPGTAGDSRLTPVSDVKSLTHGVVCHAVRAHGANRTVLTRIREGCSPR